jgi:hypothetical protein
MPTLAEEKWVRIMADFCAEAVWDKDGKSDSLDSLPVSAELRFMLAAWQDYFDENFDHNDSESSSMVDEFSRDGLALAKKVKQELPDWTVVYFDEAKARASEDQSFYQYEISLE